MKTDYNTGRSKIEKRESMRQTGGLPIVGALGAGSLAFLGTAAGGLVIEGGRFFLGGSNEPKTFVGKVEKFVENNPVSVGVATLGVGGAGLFVATQLM